MNPVKALFVINPKSGTKRKISIPDEITNNIDKNISYKIIYWETKEQDIAGIIKNYIDNENFNTVIAVGGDGTVNKIASILVNTDITFGIIPLGSGNGLARHLKIPISISKSIQLLNKGKSINIDSCSFNNNYFFCTAGIGFDAEVGKLFAKSKGRGLFNYLRIIIKVYRKYKPLNYQISFDNQTITTKAFLITFANANQWGNEAVIAPDADIQDGLINITLIKPFKFFYAFKLALSLYTYNIIYKRNVESYKARNIKFDIKDNYTLHFDGEPTDINGKVTINIIPQSLKIIVP